MSNFSDDDRFDPYGDNKGMQPTPTEMLNFQRWVTSTYSYPPNFRTLSDEDLATYVMQYSRYKRKDLNVRQWISALRSNP
jgi:hypothetical protein